MVKWLQWMIFRFSIFFCSVQVQIWRNPPCHQHCLSKGVELELDLEEGFKSDWILRKSFKGNLLALPPALSEQVGWVGGGVGGEARQCWLPQQAEQVRIHLGQLLLHNDAFWGLWVQDVSYLRNLANPSILRFPQHMLQLFWSAWIEEHVNGRQSFYDFFRNLSFIF